MKWNFDPGDPPRATGLRGPRVWVALNDGRVLFGQATFVRRAQTEFALHAWAIEEPDDLGAGMRSLPEGCAVLAYAPIVAPAFPAVKE